MTEDTKTPTPATPEVKKKSWKTTAAGIAVAVGIICAQLGNVLDSDPATTFDYSAIAAALGALGLGWFSRDKDVSSKQSGVE